MNSRQFQQLDTVELANWKTREREKEIERPISQRHSGIENKISNFQTAESIIREKPMWNVREILSGIYNALR